MNRDSTKILRTLTCLLAYCLVFSQSYADVVSTVSGPFDIPDDDVNGLRLFFDISENEVITDLQLTIEGLEHDHASELTILVIAPPPNDSINFLSTISSPRSGLPGGDSNFSGDYTFADGGADLWAAMASLGTDDGIPEGTYFPSLNDGSAHPGFAATFGGLSTAGQWEVNISDFGNEAVGQIQSATLRFTSTAVPEPSSAIVILGASVLIAFRRRR